MSFREFLENVSNPWREAIEEKDLRRLNTSVGVSNPWREAIEGGMVVFNRNL